MNLVWYFCFWRRAWRLFDMYAVHSTIEKGWNSNIIKLCESFVNHNISVNSRIYVYNFIDIISSWNINIIAFYESLFWYPILTFLYSQCQSYATIFFIFQKSLWTYSAKMYKIVQVNVPYINRFDKLQYFTEAMPHKKSINKKISNCYEVIPNKNQS